MEKAYLLTNHYSSPRLLIIRKILKTAQKLNETPVNMSINIPKSFQLNDSADRKPHKKIINTITKRPETTIIPAFVRSFESLNIYRFLSQIYS
jgi:hypothetical protein